MEDGRRLRVSVRGQGMPVVLLHGGPGIWDYLEPLETLLGDSLTVVRYDQRGCGRSDEGGPYDVGQFVGDLECLRGKLGLERWIVVGHSWGASLALAYAWRHQERVQALVYVSGTGLGQAWKVAYREECLRRLSAGQNRRLDELSGRQRDSGDEREFLMLSWSRDFADRKSAFDRAAEMLDERCRVNYECNAQINAECKTWREEDLRARCRVLTLPVLVVHGTEDPRPAWAGDSLVRALPDVERVIIDDAGHLPWVEQPQGTAEALRRFIDARVLA